jgi:hypothetical protein
VFNSASLPSCINLKYFLLKREWGNLDGKSSEVILEIMGYKCPSGLSYTDGDDGWGLYTRQQMQAELSSHQSQFEKIAHWYSCFQIKVDNNIHFCFPLK